jgi:hypothetical protein
MTFHKQYGQINQKHVEFVLECSRETEPKGCICRKRGKEIYYTEFIHVTSFSQQVRHPGEPMVWLQFRSEG